MFLIRKGVNPLLHFCEFVCPCRWDFWAMLKVPLHCRASQGVLSNEAFLSKASYLLLCIFPTPPLPRLCLNTCICVCVVFVFVLYLCLCCICISIFTDTVTSGCCQHLACLSPLTSPSWQRLHIPTCYWSIIFAYLPRSGALLYNHTRWWVNIWKVFWRVPQMEDRYTGRTLNVK